jgi:dienelactone hydrolase
MTRCVLALVLLMGCDSTKEETVSQDDTAVIVTGDTGGEPEVEELPILNGLYSTGFAVGAVAGLVVGLQFEVSMSADDDDARTIDSIIMRAVNADGDVSEPMSSAEAVPVGADGSLSVNWGPFILPADFSPTGGMVELDAVMEGKVLSDSMICGDVNGAITSFSMDLEGSTFGTVKWEDRILGTPSACEEVLLEDTLRIVDCPVITEGRTDDFPSAGQEREFQLDLPDAYDGSTPTPVVFNYHGIGGSIDGMLSAENLLEEANRTGHIIITPQALDRGGQAAWDPIGAPNYNQDVVLFDDLLTCVSDQYNIDPQRVHAMGMSLGGIFTGTLVLTRSDVLASAAPFSGGLMNFQAEGWQPIPTVVSWGGEDDFILDQDFDLLARSMMDTLSEDGHFIVGCDHGLGHALAPEVWPYAFQFFSDHPQGVDPLPYELAGLPSEFPSYCFMVD